MKKTILSMFCCLLLAGGTLRAQVPILLPNSSFEQWDSHSGYNVSVLFFNLPVYSAYTTPSGWDYLAYPVNQSVTFMGMSVNINTSIPVVLASPDTAAVPDSNTAVKLQTLMISDIVNSTVLSLAGSSIDTSLTSQVIPSILSTGQVDIDALMPIISNLLSGGGDLLSALPTLLAMDVNEFITGGIPLGGLRPGRLTGSYKFHSAVEGDNGGAIMLGTHYNTVTHQRDIVGIGINLAMIDTSVYTPFEVEYLPLSAFVPGSPNVQPDSLIVAIVSSANANMQQGSCLWVDNLVLWSAPDTCADVNSLSAVPYIHEVDLSWSVNDTVDGFEIEYGPAGFELGNGIATTATATSLTLSALDAGTQYDVYVRTLCSDSIYGDWSITQFTTLADTCASVLDLRVEYTIVDELNLHATLKWNGTSQPDHWEVEFGEQGFAPGTGFVARPIIPDYDIYNSEQAHVIAPDTWYDFYVRAVCADNVYGEWDSVHYHSTCARIGTITVHDDNIAVDADNLVSGYSISWPDTSSNQRWDVQYAIFPQDDPDIYDSQVTVDTPAFEFPPLRPDSWYRIKITPYCSDQFPGHSERKTFRTATFTGIGTVGDANLGVAVYPNPAHGQCEVSLPDGQPAELRLFSLDGRLLQEFTATGDVVVLHLPTQGVFLLQVTTPDGIQTTRIVNE